jgi:hypothetical protein
MKLHKRTCTKRSSLLSTHSRGSKVVLQTVVGGVACKFTARMDGAGVFWWAWLTNPDDSGPNGDGFTPNGRQAAKIMKQYYTQ